jgi:hypothetical protein
VDVLLTGIARIVVENSSKLGCRGAVTPGIYSDTSLWGNEDIEVQSALLVCGERAGFKITQTIVC